MDTKRRTGNTFRPGTRLFPNRRGNIKALFVASVKTAEHPAGGVPRRPLVSRCEVDLSRRGKLGRGAVRTVRDGPGASEGCRTLMVRDGKPDKVKLDELTAAIETAKTLAETKPFQTETRRQENHRASKAAVKGAVRNRGCA